MPALEIWHDLKTWITRKAPQLEKYDVSQGDEDFLGQGQAGTRVYSGTHKPTLKKCAVKVISKNGITKEKKATIRREAQIMEEISKVPHENIVSFVEYFEDRKNFYIIMELMEGGEVFQQISERGSFTESEARNVMWQVAKGVQFLHDQGIVHRDLKPENLLCSKPNSLTTIKICDFGMAKRIGNSLANTPCGTVTYVAPEVIKTQGIEAAGYGKKADIWSLGVIMFLLLSGRPPFYDDEPDNVLRKIKAGLFDFPELEWAYVSENAKDLVRQCLVRDPNQRVDIQEFLRHQWFKELVKTDEVVEEVKLQSPVKLKEGSVLISEFLRLLTPQALANINNAKEASPDDSPVPIFMSYFEEDEENQPPPYSANQSDDDSPDLQITKNKTAAIKKEVFYRWKVGRAGLEFELPKYYKEVREATFRGNGLFCSAVNTQLSTEVAIRKYSKVTLDRAAHERLFNELFVLKQLRHENVLSIFDGFVGPSEDTYVATELYDCSLKEILVERPLTEDEIQSVMSQLFRALMYIHSGGIVHANLRPSSMFAKTSFQKICRMVLGDFSSSSILPFVDRRDKTAQKNYWPPERLLGGTLDFSGDIWAAGCIFAEFLERKVAFWGTERADVVRSITLLLGTPSRQLLRREYKCSTQVCAEMLAVAPQEPIDFAKRFPNTSPEALDLLKKMLCLDPTKRISASGALAHPFLSKHRVFAKERICTEFEPRRYPVAPTQWRAELLSQLESINIQMFERTTSSEIEVANLKYE